MKKGLKFSQTEYKKEMQLTETALIQQILSQYKKIAVIGLSDDPSRPSYGVTQYMMSKGYEVCGVRPHTKEILGRPCFSSLAECPKPIEIVNVFRKSEAVAEIVTESIAVGAKVLWLQEGVSDPVSEDRAKKAGLLVVSDKCLLKEHKRIRL
jgi:predicted CoA-binding protein